LLNEEETFVSGVGILISFPTWGPGVLQVWKRNWLHFKYTFWVTLFWILLEPLFYLAAIGYGLGSFVPAIDGQSYAEFFFPSLLCSTAMMVPFFESTYSNFTKLTWMKTYSTILLSPISTSEIFLGELLWSSTKALFGVFGVAVVAKFFGAYDTWMIVPVVFVLFLQAFVFSALGMLFTTYASNYDSFIYSSSGFIIPMSLFSGTYFPIDHLPTLVRWLAYLLPLTHGVSSVRQILVNNLDKTLAFHLLILLIFAVIFMNWSYHRFHNKLVN
jgi:lipooligosaccharide transport system permease protein